MDGWMDVWKRRAGGEKIRGVEVVEGAPRRLGSRSAARKGGGGGWTEARAPPLRLRGYGSSKDNKAMIRSL